MSDKFTSFNYPSECLYSTYTKWLKIKCLFVLARYLLRVDNTGKKSSSKLTN